MSTLRRSIKTLRRKEYQLIKIRFTHRNMRKLASLYKEFKGNKIRFGYGQFRLRFKHTTRYRRHPNDGLTRSFDEGLKHPEYIYINFGMFDYGKKSMYTTSRTIYIENLNQESENLIRYIANRIKVGNTDDLPF